MKSVGGQVLRATTLLSASGFMVTALGFLKNLVAAYYFGTSKEMDTYLLALVVPDMAHFLSTSGLFNFIPVFAEQRATHGEKEALRTAGKMATYWVVLLWSVLIACFLAAPWLVSWVAPGYAGPARVATVAHTRVLIFMAVSVGSARIMAALLMARKSFVVASLAEVTFQVTSMAYLVVFHKHGIDALVWGMVLGGFCQLGVTASGLALQGVQLPLSLHFRHPAVVKMIRLALPTYIGNAGGQLNTFISRVFASMLAAGAVSGLQYAYFMVESLASIVGQALSQALLPFLSQQHAEKETYGFARSLDRGLVAMSILLMPISVGLCLLARPVVQLLLERGSFDAHSSELTVSAMRFYAPSLLAVALDYLLRTVYFAQQFTAAPVYFGFARLAFTAVACSLLTPRLGHIGIAVATTGGHYFKLLVMLYFLRRKKEQRAALAAAGRSLTKVAQAVAVMGVVVYLVTPHVLPGHVSLSKTGVLYFAVPVSVGFLAYVVTLYFLSAADFTYFLHMLRQLTGSRSWGRAPAEVEAGSGG
jgi:putative peptidoglycan lipid II flippase